MHIDANKTLRDLRTMVSRVLSDERLVDPTGARETAMATMVRDLDKHLRGGHPMPDDWALRRGPKGK